MAAVPDGVLLEAIVRGIAAGLFLATAIIIVRFRPTASRIAGTLAYLSKAAHVFVQFPPAMAPLALYSWGLTLPAITGAALTWLFATEFFGDDRRFDRRKLIPVFVVLGIGVAAAFSPPRVALALWLLHTFISVALMTHVLVILASRWQGDLVERRRLIATPVFVISAVYSMGVGFVQTIEAFAHTLRQPSLFAAFVLLFSSALAVIVFGQAGPSLFGDVPDTAKARAMETPAAATPLTGSDAVLAAELERLMRTERLYRTQNLRISSLALALRTPEHRLRQLLNYGLGFRNFNAYIGQWRLGEAKEALADPEQQAVPISTIAIDSGFQSLAPFNRAFKGETGMTPTEFRAKALGNLAAAEAGS